MKKNLYSLVPHLDSIYNSNAKVHRAPVCATFLRWQKVKRASLRRLLGYVPVSVLKEHLKEKKEIEGSLIEVWDLHMSDGTIMPLWIGFPKEVKAFRPIVIYHGHSDGAQTLFGVGMTKEYQDFALEFLKNGYTVFAPDQRGFRDRLAPSPLHYNGYTRSCRQLAFNLMLNGRTVLGERVADGIALFSWIREKREGDSLKIAVTGNSGGGTVSLLHAALDARVSAAIVSGAFCTYKDSIMELSHCECNYVPNIFSTFKEIWEVAALIAPRPLLVVHGNKDAIFPVQATIRAFKILKTYYEKIPQSSKKLMISVQNGGHRYYHDDVFTFLNRI